MAGMNAMSCAHSAGMKLIGPSTSTVLDSRALQKASASTRLMFPMSNIGPVFSDPLNRNQFTSPGGCSTIFCRNSSAMIVASTCSGHPAFGILHPVSGCEPRFGDTNHIANSHSLPIVSARGLCLRNSSGSIRHGISNSFGAAASTPRCMTSSRCSGTFRHVLSARAAAAIDSAAGSVETSSTSISDELAPENEAITKDNRAAEERSRNSNEQEPDEEGPWKVKMLYDGDCPLCMREVDFLRERNAAYDAIKFVDISAEDYSPEENANITFEEAMGHIHGIERDGTVLRSVEAFRRFYEVVGLGWVYSITKFKPVAKVADAVYNVWAKYRLPLTGRPSIQAVLDERRRAKEGDVGCREDEPCEAKW